MEKYLSAQSSTIRLILGILLSILVAGLLFIIGIMAGNMIFGVKTLELQHLAQTGDNVAVLRYMLILQAVSIFIAPSICIGMMLQKPDRAFFRFKKNVRPAVYLIAGAAIVAAMPFLNLIAEMNSLLIDRIMGAGNWMAVAEASAKQLTESLLLTTDWVNMLQNIVVMAALPAMAEELFFRGTIQELIERGTKNPHVAVIVTAVIFSALHIQFYGFIPRVAMGIFLGYLYIWFRSLWLPIAVHFVNNAAAVILSYLIQCKHIPQWVENIGSDTATIGLSFASFACIMYAIVLLAKYARIPLAPNWSSKGPKFKL